MSRCLPAYKSKNFRLVAVISQGEKWAQKICALGKKKLESSSLISNIFFVRLL